MIKNIGKLETKNFKIYKTKKKFKKLKYIGKVSEENINFDDIVSELDKNQYQNSLNFIKIITKILDVKMIPYPIPIYISNKTGKIMTAKEIYSKSRLTKNLNKIKTIKKKLAQNPWTVYTYFYYIMKYLSMNEGIKSIVSFSTNKQIIIKLVLIFVDGGSVTSRHANAIIYNPKSKSILYFEPQDYIGGTNVLIYNELQKLKQMTDKVSRIIMYDHKFQTVLNRTCSYWVDYFLFHYIIRDYSDKTFDELKDKNPIISLENYTREIKYFILYMDDILKEKRKYLII